MIPFCSMTLGSFVSLLLLQTLAGLLAARDSSVTQAENPNCAFWLSPVSSAHKLEVCAQTQSSPVAASLTGRSRCSWWVVISRLAEAHSAALMAPNVSCQSCPHCPASQEAQCWQSSSSGSSRPGLVKVRGWQRLASHCGPLGRTGGVPKDPSSWVSRVTLQHRRGTVGSTSFWAHSGRAHPSHSPTLQGCYEGNGGKRG